MQSMHRDDRTKRLSTKPNIRAAQLNFGPWRDSCKAVTIPVFTSPLKSSAPNHGVPQAIISVRGPLLSPKLSASMPMALIIVM